MPDYRIYLISGGHIKAGYDYVFETDEEARSQARRMLGKYAGAEVWIGTKRICLEVLQTPPEADHALGDFQSSKTI